MISIYTLSVLSILLYLYAFFPTAKDRQSILVKPPENLHDIKFNVSSVYKEVVDRVVIIVIDALRHDFISAENMPFITTAAQNDGCSVLVKAESPTVTLPRIKALTTGSVPQFIDIVLNLMSSEVFQDSLLHRAVEERKKIVFYGDNTWLKMYPDMFIRSEGTSSFYVNDFTEVDNNVTRNVDKELVNDDWDVMILHYLGLDHIGHISGPYSHLVRPKLKEMDDIIKRIYSSLRQSERRLLIAVTGDHGMKDSGGHGGTTYSETRVPLILLGIPCKNDSFPQTDIPVTLSALMGLVLPADSIGKISSLVLNISEHSPEELLYILRYNVLALQRKVNLCDEVFDNVTNDHYKFLHNKNYTLFVQVKNSYESCARKISDSLLHSSVQQNNLALIVSCASITFCFFLNLVTLNLNRLSRKQVLEQLIVLIVLFLMYLDKVNLITVCIIGSYMFISLSKYVIAYFKCISEIHAVSAILIVSCVLHSLSLMSSSFVEEEHQTWYFAMGTFLVFTSVGAFKASPHIAFYNVLVFTGLRCIRKLNQTGDKWAFLSDFADWLLLGENVVYLHIFLIFSFISILMCCKQITNHKTNLHLVTLVLICIYVLKTFCIGSYRLGQLTWGLIFINIVINVKLLEPIENCIETWILISCLLMRSYNVVLLSYCVTTSLIFYKQIKTSSTLIMMHVFLGYVLYFCQGHSNSLASIDIASGYTGLESYKPIIVGLLVLCHTYSLPILTHLLLLKYVNNCDVWRLLLTHRLLIVLIVFISTYVQRHHLFIWTVFAPKLLIESSHSFILFVEIMLYSFVKFVAYIRYVIFDNKV